MTNRNGRFTRPMGNEKVWMRVLTVCALAVLTLAVCAPDARAQGFRFGRMGADPNFSASQLVANSAAAF